MRFSRLPSCYQVYLPQAFFNEDSNIFSCISSHPETHNNFIAEIDFWLRIALINIAHPQVHFTSHRNAQHHLRRTPSRLPQHLALLLIAMVIHFLQPPPLCQVNSHWSSRHYHSTMSVAKQAWHGHLPYKRNSFSSSYQQ